MKEIVTLQIGKVSNYVGTHFWNINDEVLSLDQQQVEQVDDYEMENLQQIHRELNPEVLYKVTEHSCLPRMVMVDFKFNAGAFDPLKTLARGTKNVFGISDDTLKEQVSSIWGGAVEVHREPEAQKNDFIKWLEDQAFQVQETATMSDFSSYHREEMDELETEKEQVVVKEEEEEGGGGGEEEGDGDLYLKHRVRDEEVKSWSDFLKSRVHHKSTVFLHKYIDEDYEMFISGYDQCSSTEKLDQLMEPIRYFLEDCDRVQGVHALVDVNSGHGALARKMLEELKEEIGSASILVAGLTGTEPGSSSFPSDTKFEQYKARRDLNQALGMHYFTDEVCSMYVPIPLYSLERMSSPFISSENFHAKSLFHASAIAAAGLETMTLPYRRSKPSFGPNSAVTIGEMISRLSPREDVKLGSLSMSFPFPHPLISEEDLTEMFTESWEPYNSPKSQIDINLSSTFPLQRDVSPYTTFGSSIVLRGVQAKHNARLEEVVGNYSMRTSIKASMYPLYSSVQMPFPVTLAYPNIFNNHLLGRKGEIAVTTNNTRDRAIPPESVPMITNLETSTKLSKDVQHAYKTVSKISQTLRLDYSKGSNGLMEEDYEDITERLEALGNTYEHK